MYLIVPDAELSSKQISDAASEKDNTCEQDNEQTQKDETGENKFNILYTSYSYQVFIQFTIENDCRPLYFAAAKPVKRVWGRRRRRWGMK